MRLLIKYFPIGSLFLLFHFSASCQQENVWVFGWRGCMELDFNSGSPTPVALPYATYLGVGGNNVSNSVNNYTGSSASVCDADGQLLFYTDGSYIGDRNSNLMQNGTALTGLSLNNDSDVTFSQGQGALIVPMPDSIGKYYIFSLTGTGDLSGSPIAGRLYYSVVDMALNGGLGAVVQGRKGILIDSNLSASMAGVVGDRCNIWVVVRSATKSQFKAFEITNAGVNITPVISPAGGPSIYNSYIPGAICFSPNRKKMAIAHYSYNGILELYDFNGATGTLSNRIVLDSGNDNTNHDLKHYHGVCFSPDNSKVYANTNQIPDSLCQFDISSGDPATMMNSRYYVGYSESSTLALGPDGKIYFVTEDGSNNSPYGDTASGIVIGSINQPDEYGAACQYVFNAIPSTYTVFPLGFNGTADYNCWFCSLPNAVPVFHRDTTSSYQQLSTACFATSYTIHANDSGWDYHWDNDTSIQTYLPVDSAGNYVVHYYTAPCTYHSDTFYIYFSSPLPSTGSLSGCPGLRNGKAWIKPQNGDTSTYTYTWTDGLGNTLQLPTTSSIVADTLYNQYAGTYLVSISGSNGCDTTLSVIIAPPVDSGFLSVSDTGMCPHDTINIHVSGGILYHWSVDSSTYISDTASANPMVSPPTDWTYTVYGKNLSGCLDTAIAKVHVYPEAVIQLPDSVTLYYDQSFQFSPGTNCLSFNWFPPLGLSADNISNPVASPPVNTKYIVTGTTEYGCTVQESVNVYRSDDVLLTLPNAFAPGNGPDNLLKPIYRGNIQLDYLRIFSRWGEMVYESSDLDKGWDGTWHGMPQPQGVFIYTMHGHTADGKILSKQGNITLLR